VIEQDFDERLSAYIDGALSDEDRRAVEERLARDEAARARLAELRKIVDAVRSLPKASAPPGLAGDVMDRIRQTARPARGPVFRTFFAGVGLAAAAVFVAFIVSVVLPPAGRHETPEDRNFALSDGEPMSDQTLGRQIRTESAREAGAEVSLHARRSGVARGIEADDASEMPAAAPPPVAAFGAAGEAESLGAARPKAKDGWKFAVDAPEAAQGPAVAAQRAEPAMRPEEEEVERLRGRGYAGAAAGVPLRAAEAFNESDDYGKGQEKGGAPVPETETATVDRLQYRQGAKRAGDRLVGGGLGDADKQTAVAAANMRIAEVLRREGYHQLASLLVPVDADRKDLKEIAHAPKRDSAAVGKSEGRVTARSLRKRAPTPLDPSIFSNVFFVETPPAEGKQASRVTILTNGDTVETNRKSFSAKGDVYVYYRTPAGGYVMLGELEQAFKDERGDADKSKPAASKPAEALNEAKAPARSAPSARSLVVIVPRATKEKE